MDDNELEALRSEGGPMGYDAELEAIENEIDELMGRPARQKIARHEKAVAGNSGVGEKSGKRRWQTFFQGAAKRAGKVLFFPVIAPLDSVKVMDQEGQETTRRRGVGMRICYGIMTRLVITPVLLGVFAMGLVWKTTHPRHVQAAETPEMRGMFYQSVEFQNADGQSLAGWYVPPLTAERVLERGDSALAQQWPAVVLLHDIGASNDANLSLAEALHDSGFAVLLMDFRGQGHSAAAAVTFGLRERFDVLAAVRFLRQRPEVDGRHIALMGQGMGATAALEAGALDHSIAAIVAENPCVSFEQHVKNIFEPAHVPADLGAGLYRFTFELMLRERTEELNLARIGPLLQLPVMVLVRPEEGDGALMDAAAFTSTLGGTHKLWGGEQARNETATTREIVKFLEQYDAQISTDGSAQQGTADPAVARLLRAQVR